MKIQQIKIKEFKKLKNIDKEIKGNNILVFGDNEVGKTTFLQFIGIALGDKTNIPPGVNGSGEVVVEIDGESYTFKVKLNDGKPVVTIVAPNGMKDDRKGSLAKLVGAVGFDIDKFVEMSKSEKGRKEQIEIFKSFFPSEIQAEISNHEVNVKTKFDERTELNRDIKKLEIEIEASPLKNMDLSKLIAGKVDTTEIYEKLKGAQTVNEDIAGVQARMDSRQDTIDAEASAIKTLEEKISKLKESIADNETKNKQAKDWLSQKENQPIDITEFEKTIEGASLANENAKDAQSLTDKIALLSKMRGESEDLTVLVETGRQLIQDTIKDIGGPIGGLTFTEDNLVYNDVPVHPASLSESQIMLLGIKLKIAQNPNTPLLIERGESIGAKKLKEIMDLGLQVIMEEVRRGEEELHIEIMEG